MCYTHTMEYHSAIKKGIMPFLTMDETWGHYAKWNKSEKDKSYMISLIVASYVGSCGFCSLICKLIERVD